MQAELPLFPLGTVLFPGGVLPLRVFEARYVDMVGECMRSAAPFGVCLITKGREVGEAAEHEPVGCLARIVDFDMEQPGLLQIRAIGSGRFRVLERRVQKDGLVRVLIEAIADDPLEPPAAEHAGCVALARRIAEDLEAREPDPAKRPIAMPYQFDSAAWVANRLCELLPIPVRARQKLMELEDAGTRLSLVHQFLSQRGVL